MRRDAEGFVVRGNRFSHMHDDAWLENDWEHSGVYEDNYADGLVGFSARPYLKGAATPAGLQRTLMIHNATTSCGSNPCGASKSAQSPATVACSSGGTVRAMGCGSR